MATKTPAYLTAFYGLLRDLGHIVFPAHSVPVSVCKYVSKYVTKEVLRSERAIRTLVRLSKNCVVAAFLNQNNGLKDAKKYLELREAAELADNSQRFHHLV